MTRVVLVRGEPMTVYDPGEYLSDVVASTGDYFEADVLDAVAPMVRPGTVIDAGAMLGNHALYLARHVPGVHVEAFEPNPVNLPLLRENAERVANVRVRGVALGSARERATFGFASSEPGHTMRRAGGIRFRAEVVRLDAYHFPDVSLLKLDVEGDEPSVLAGARDTLRRCRPVIVIEDWQRAYGFLLPGYSLVASFDQHQTYIYAPT